MYIRYQKEKDIEIIENNENSQQNTIQNIFFNIISVPKKCTIAIF